jgi:hypothetical protein
MKHSKMHRFFSLLDPYWTLRIIPRSTSVVEVRNNECVNPTKEYIPGASILLEALVGSHAQIWKGVWSRYVTERLAEHAYGYIDFATGQVRQHFLELDDPVKRSDLVKNDSVAVRDCVELFMKCRADLDAIFSDRGIRRKSNIQLRTLLDQGGVIATLINGPSSNAVLISITGKNIWGALAHQIARAIHSQESAEGRDEEWMLWNKLLLSRFFYACQLSSAQQVLGQLGSLVRGFHGPRSCLLAITERVNQDGILDPSLPVVSGHSSSSSPPLKGSHLSDLIGAIQYEHGQMLRGTGIVHRTADPNAPTLIPTSLRRILTSSQLKVLRDRAYRQHEAAILCYGALSAIEQMLRSLASHVGIRHLKSNGTPKSVGQWLDDPRLRLNEGLLDRLRELYSADGANLRNRALHAGLLETSSRSLDVILAAYSFGTAPVQPQDPYIAENLLNLFLRHLGDLDAHIVGNGVSSTDFGWATNLWLSNEEVDFGHRLSCDVLRRDESEAWRIQLFSFIDRSLPCIATYARMAWLGWMESFQRHDSVISFLAWGIVFEALYRQTLHVIGFDVIQRSQVNGKDWMFQYRMLETGLHGLCSPEAMAALVEVLRPEERAIAERTVTLAVKTRNALSHGALVLHTEDGHLGAGHLFIKATQLLLAVIKVHMTREGAYYRSLQRTSLVQGDSAQDWLHAENATYDLFESPAY